MSIQFSSAEPSEIIRPENHIITLDKQFLTSLLSPYLEICEDKMEITKPEEIFSDTAKNCTLLSFVGNIPNFGYTTSTFWAKFSLHNLTDKTTFFLEYAFSAIQNVELYEQDKSRITSQLTGKNFPFFSRPIFSRNFIFSLIVQPGATKTYIIRIKTLGAVQIPLFLHTPEAMVKKIQTEMLGFGIYYGLILIMALYNLALFFFVREKSFLFYVSYILSLVILQMCLSGNAIVWLWPSLVAWNRISTVVMVGITFFWLIAFTKSYYSAAFELRRRIRVLLSALQLACLLLSVGGFFVYGPLLIKLTGLLGFAVPVILFIVSFSTSRNNPSGRFFVVAVGFFLSGSILYSLKDLGLISSNFFTENAIVFGSTLEIALFSLGLGYKIRTLDRIKNEQELALAQMHEHNQLLKVENEMANLSSKIARQVAHDIRSPLSALTMVIGTFKEIPEENRTLIRNATQRISDIANDLLQKSKKKASTEQEWHKNNKHTFKTQTELIPAVVDLIVSEKRIQYRDKIDVEIVSDFSHSYNEFAEINTSELKRVLSNLINNSVEAFADQKGKITVSIRGDKKTVVIVVNDNGKGIPEHIFAKLGEKGISHGKEDTTSGSGLGIYHAKQSIEACYGKFEIQSRLGEGTTITISFPKVQPPNWFVEKLILKTNMQVISLDDDLSIHQIWKGRLQSLNSESFDITLLSFTSGNEFKKYIEAQVNNRYLQKIFLVDYELLNQNMTGLDFIEELDLVGTTNTAILVTSRYEEEHIRNRCAKLDVKLIPKGMAGFVPIEIEKHKIKYDAILIDDDDLIHMTWQIVAKEKNKTVNLLKTETEFLTIVNKIDPMTPVYVDVNLGQNVNGVEVAKRIHELGFLKVYLATGYAEMEKPGFIEAIVGKDPQF